MVDHRGGVIQWWTGGRLQGRVDTMVEGWSPG